MQQVAAALPDGRRISASQAERTGPWTVHILGEEDRGVARRWLLDALSELLELPRSDKPQWVFDAIEELSGYDTPLGRRYPCPCCDYLTMLKPPPGTHAICPVCRWEDDLVQYQDLDYAGGANKGTLRHARQHFRMHGISDSRKRGTTRPPLPEERPPQPH
jgi:hypothetical protein